MGAVGYEHPQISIENPQISNQSGADSGAVKAMIGEETLELVRMMADMPKPLRDAVIQIARSAKVGE